MQGGRHAESNGVSVAGTLENYAGFTQLSGDGRVLQQRASLPNQTLDAGGRSGDEPSHLLECCKYSQYRASLSARVRGPRPASRSSSPLLDTGWPADRGSGRDEGLLGGGLLETLDAISMQ